MYLLRFLNINIPVFLALVFFSSCQNEPSLEKYIVHNQNDPAFMSMDVPAGLFLKEKNMSAMPKNVQEAIKTVDKANVIALPLDGNKQFMQEEVSKVEDILNQEKYKRLLNLNVQGKMIHIMYSGKKDDINEIIVFGKDPEKGFGIVRLLGHGMNAEAISTIIAAAKSDQLKFNSDAFSGFSDLMEKN